MHWNKKGRILEVRGQSEWMNSHATAPTAYHLRDDLYRVYFSTRDKLQRNQVGFADIRFAERTEVLRISEEPVLRLGSLGHFDCDGIYGTSLVQTEDELRLYYAGWNAGLRGLFYSSIGVAVSRDGGDSFQRLGSSPILGRDEIDPWAVMAPFVLKVSDHHWVMWYASGIELSYDESNTLRSSYDVKTALSSDGLNWKKTGKTAIGLGSEDSNVARACVLSSGDGFEAWYPYVSRSINQYRIGFGRSADGLTFDRMDQSDEAQLLPSKDDDSWDNQAVAHPFVFEHGGSRYMLYNGNDFGRTGFGLAIWQ